MKILQKRFYHQNPVDLNLLKNWQKCLDKCGVVKPVLMDLSKAYDCRPYDLLLAKLLVCGFDVSAIALIANYLSNRYQNVKIGSTFTSCVEILRAVPSSSITGLMLSNLFINGLMFFIQDKKQMAATLPMIQQYIHAHQILKRQL